MVEVGELSFFTDGDFNVNEELTGGKLMQYTGLKDKNGKEIYEGDLFNYMCDDGCIEKNCEVVFNDGAFRTRWGCLIKDIIDWEFEVIGNIYENPELLNNI